MVQFYVVEIHNKVISNHFLYKKKMLQSYENPIIVQYGLVLHIMKGHFVKKQPT